MRPAPTDSPTRPPCFLATRAYVDTFGDQGGIAGIGAFDRPETNGAMCIFSSRDSAVEFLESDPLTFQS